MSQYLTDAQVEEAIEFMLAHAQEIGRAKARVEALEGQKKHLIAGLMRQAEAEAGGKLAAVLQERDAYASDDFKGFLTKQRQANEDYETLKWELETRQILISAWQTINANARAFPKL